MRSARVIRRIDPVTPTLIAADQLDSPGAFTRLEPVGMANVVCQVHMCVPRGLTHQDVKTNLTWHRLSRNDRGPRPGQGGLASCHA